MEVDGIFRSSISSQLLFTSFQSHAPEPGDSGDLGDLVGVTLLGLHFVIEPGFLSVLDEVRF